MSGHSRICAADIITLGRAGLGLWSIQLALAGLHEAAIPLLLVAMVLDGVDGEVARRSGKCSGLGVRLDGAADWVCFVLAPAVFLYSASGAPWPRPLPGDPTFLPFVASLALLSLGSVRIVRFVRRDAGGRDFVGLPTASLALVVICLFHPDVQAAVGRVATLGLVSLMSPLMLGGPRFPKLTTGPALTAGLLMGLVALDMAGRVLSGEGYPGYPVVWPLLGANAIYILAGPFYLAGRRGGTRRRDHGR